MPLIVISGYDSNAPDFTAMLRNFGASDFVSKHNLVKELIPAIERLAGGTP